MSEEQGVDAGVQYLENWDVLAVRGKGLYIKGEEDPWLVVSHDQLSRKDDELSETYFEAVE